MSKLGKFAAACAAVLCVFGASAGSVFAATWWVAKDGSDAAAGSEEAPFATLSNAFAHASSETRDTIRIKDGTYPSTGAIIVNKAVEIVGNDADRSQVVIDGEKTKALLGISHADVFVHGITFANGGANVGMSVSGSPSFFQCSFQMSAGVLSNCTVKAGKTQYAGCLTVPNGSPRIVDCSIEDGYNNDNNGSGAGMGGGVKLNGTPELVNSVITNCSAHYGGGIYMVGSPKVIGCTIVGNKARGGYGGGIEIKGGVVSNCVVRGNTGSSYGGGIYQLVDSTVINTVVSGHSSKVGGGVYKTAGKLINCTVAGNVASTSGSAVHQTNGSLINVAGGTTNRVEAFEIAGGTVSHSCGTGLTTDGETGNFGEDPIFRDEETGDYSLKGSSKCIDSGVAQAWAADAKDVTGENDRVLDGNGDGDAVVDIGAYEYDPSKAPTTLSFFVSVADSDVFPRTVTFVPNLEGNYGEVTSVKWDFGDGETDENLPLETLTHDYQAAGDYSVKLTVSTTLLAQPLTYEVPSAAFLMPAVVYVSRTGTATWPYDTEKKATPNIDEALAVLKIPVGRCKVIVADGTYDPPAKRPTLGMAIEVVGNDDDPTAVTFDGGGKRGFFFVNHDSAFVHGLRLYNGYMAEQRAFPEADNFSGSPLVIRYGVVSNCVYETCKGSFCGGVSMHGTSQLYDTAISGVTSTDHGSADVGGGLRMYGTPVVERCSITASSGNVGGGAGVYGGTMRNCRIFGNTATSQGGGLYVKAGTVENCVVVSNKTSSGGSGAGAYVCGGTVRNSLAAWNSTPNGTGSGAYMTSGNIQNCTVAENDGGTVCNGVYLKGGTLVNSAVSGAAAPINNESGTVKSCCALSLTEDKTLGNIKAEPGFRNAADGDFSLVGASKCIDAGEELAWHVDAMDLTGETPRVLQRVDIGAYEYDPSTAPASISFSVTGGEAVEYPHTATFTLKPEGECGEITSCTWDFGDGKSESTDNLDPMFHTYEAVGVYAVSVSVETTLKGTLTAENPEAVRIKPCVVFVATNGTHVAPYHTLATAATNITDALKELGYPTDGSRAKVIVADGVYPAPKERTTLSDAVELVGNDADPTAVTFDGEGKRELFFVDHSNAVVHGIRFWRGRTEYSGGSASDAPSYSRAPFELRQGVASNCVFESNNGGYSSLTAWNTGAVLDCRIIGGVNRDNNGIATGAGHGGGMKLFNSAVCRGCTFTNCTAQWGGALAIRGGTAENCTFVGNKAPGGYGGGVFQTTGMLRGALIVGNTAASGAGGLHQEGGTAVNVTIADNVSPASAGAKVAGTLINSIVVGKGEYDPANPPLVVSGAGAVRKCCSPSLTADDCLSVDPLFVRREAGDYAIRGSSKCVGFGDNSAWPNLKTAVDLNGNRRLKGQRIDLGGYESDGAGMLLLVK